MNKKTIIIWIIVGSVIGLAIIFVSVKGLQNLNSGSNVGIQNKNKNKATAPGANIIGKEGVVLTPEGKPARNDVAPGSPDAPKQTLSLSEKEIPKDSVKLVMSTGKITPGNFTVKAGSIITLTLSAGDVAAHIFRFRDPALEAIAAGISPDETRAVTFNAPKKPGEYEFYCDSLKHADLGERGVMTVK